VKEEDDPEDFGRGRTEAEDSIMDESDEEEEEVGGMLDGEDEDE
jgi:hypothetical protein